MYPPGSGYPPNIMNVSTSCNSKGGVLSFDCNKSIAGSTASIYLINRNTGSAFWRGSINEYTNAGHFEVENIPNGRYYIAANNGEADVEDEDFDITCNISLTELAIVSVDGGNASTKTAKDATALVNLSDSPASTPNVVETHLGDFNWVAAAEVTPGNYLATYTKLGAGLHTVFARDSTGQVAQYTFNTTYTKILGCTNPNAKNYNKDATDDDGTCVIPLPSEKPNFLVPLMNSLRFVPFVDEFNSPPTPDNRIYCRENWLAIKKPAYYQKVARVDVITTQFRSNYDNHLCEIINYETGQTILTPAAVKKQQYRGIVRQYPGWLTAHDADATKSRLYFNGGALPIAFAAGDELELKNATPPSLNQQYGVSAVAFNASDNIPYLIINLPYPVTVPATQRINLNIETVYDTLPFDIFEFTPVWGNIPNGVYYAKITATSSQAGFVDAVWFCEPFALYPEHPFTNLLTYRNFDDTQALVFGTGLICTIRVESDFWQRFPGGTRVVYRNPGGRLQKLDAKSYRKVKFNTYGLPPWLHEKLAFLFDYDYVTINGEEFQTEDGYAEPGYIARLALSNSSIMVEQVNLFDEQNGFDIADVNGTGGTFLILNNEFVRL
jgi:hypothetical protein